MTVIQQIPEKLEMKQTKMDEDAEAACSPEEWQSTPKCRETLRVLSEIFESMESLETCQQNADAVSS